MNYRIAIPMLAALAASVAGPAAAHGPAGHEEDIELLQSSALPELPGKQANLLKVHYRPGASSAAHTHPGSVFAYVLEGAVVSQLDGQPPVTYGAGQSWYEAPGARHLVSRNASTTAPATLLVWMVKAGDEAPVLPLAREQQR
jgi:quercetin dioxygenase-like cupin family protein